MPSTAISRPHNLDNPGESFIRGTIHDPHKLNEAKREVESMAKSHGVESIKTFEAITKYFMVLSDATGTSLKSRKRHVTLMAKNSLSVGYDSEGHPVTLVDNSAEDNLPVSYSSSQKRQFFEKLAAHNVYINEILKAGMDNFLSTPILEVPEGFKRLAKWPARSA